MYHGVLCLRAFTHAFLLLGLFCLLPLRFAYLSSYLTFRCQSNSTPSGNLPWSIWSCSILNLSFVALNMSVVHYFLVISLIPSFLLDWLIGIIIIHCLTSWVLTNWTCTQRMGNSGQYPRGTGKIVRGHRLGLKLKWAFLFSCPLGPDAKVSNLPILVRSRKRAESVDMGIQKLWGCCLSYS